MNKIKQQIINRARKAHKRIYPCTTKSSLIDCFTAEGSKLLFWFNTDDQTTHLLITDLSQEDR